MTTGRKDANKEREERCNDTCSGRGGTELDDTCSGRGRTGLILWGIIVTLIGIWVIFEFGIKNITGLPSWLYNLQWGWIFGVVIGIAILIGGLSILRRANKR
jgi:hypothetical protein